MYIITSPTKRNDIYPTYVGETVVAETVGGSVAGIVVAGDDLCNLNWWHTKLHKSWMTVWDLNVVGEIVVNGAVPAIVGAIEFLFYIIVYYILVFSILKTM